MSKTTPPILKEAMILVILEKFQMGTLTDEDKRIFINALEASLDKPNLRYDPVKRMSQDSFSLLRALKRLILEKVYPIDERPDYVNDILKEKLSFSVEAAKETIESLLEVVPFL